MWGPCEGYDQHKFCVCECRPSTTTGGLFINSFWHQLHWALARHYQHPVHTSPPLRGEREEACAACKGKSEAPSISQSQAPIGTGERTRMGWGGLPWVDILEDPLRNPGTMCPNMRRWAFCWVKAFCSFARIPDLTGHIKPSHRLRIHMTSRCVKTARRPNSQPGDSREL